jgi:hypothetical protein
MHTNCLLKHVIPGEIEVMGGQGRTRKQLLIDLKETRENYKFKYVSMYGMGRLRTLFLDSFYSSLRS